MKLLFTTLLIISSLFLTGCGGSQVYVGAEAGPVDVTVAVDNNGDVSVSGGVAPKFKVGLGPIELKVGIQQTIELTKEKSFALFVIWEDENGEIQREEYEIGKTFHVKFTQNEFIKEIQGNNNSVIVVVQKNKAKLPTSTSITFRPTETNQPSAFEFTVYANKRWQDTDISVYQGNRIIIKYVTGNWTLAKNLPNTHPWVGADGYIPERPEWAAGDSRKALPGVPYGTLIGRINTGVPFKVGQQLSLVANGTGNLWLGVNDNQDRDEDIQDNDGSIIVQITIYP